MKKTWLITVLLVVALALGVTLTACQDTPDPLPTYTVTVAQVTNGTVTITGVDGETHENYEQNSAVTVNVTPAQGYEVANVTVDGKSVSLTEGKYTFAIKANTQVAASFQSIVVVPTYTVTVGEVANGTVTVADVHGQAQASYEEGSVVVVNVAPAAHYQVASVTVGEKAVNLTEGQYGFVIGANTQIVATFELIPHAVTVDYDAAKGNVVVANGEENAVKKYDVEGNEYLAFNETDTVNVTVNPANAYVVDTVKVNGTEVTLNAENKHSFEVSVNAAIEVTFKFDEAHQALHNALAEIAASKYTMTQNSNLDSSSVSEKYFIINDDMMAYISSVYAAGPQMYGYLMYEGYARYIYTHTAASHTLTFKDEEGKALYKSIEAMRISYNIDEYMGYLVLQDGKYVLKDTSNGGAITAAVMANLLEVCKDFAPSADYAKYTDIAIELDDDGHLSVITYTYPYSSYYNYKASHTYTIGALQDDDEITFLYYGSEKNTTYGAVKENLLLKESDATWTVTLQSALDANKGYAGEYKNGDVTLTIAPNGITVGEKEFVITAMPSYGGGGSYDIGKQIKGTIDGKAYTLTIVSAEKMSLQAADEETATEYVAPPKPLGIPEACYGTYKDGNTTVTITEYEIQVVWEGTPKIATFNSTGSYGGDLTISIRVDSTTWTITMYNLADGHYGRLSIETNRDDYHTCERVVEEA